MTVSNSPLQSCSFPRHLLVSNIALKIATASLCTSAQSVNKTNPASELHCAQTSAASQRALITGVIVSSSFIPVVIPTAEARTTWQSLVRPNASISSAVTTASASRSDLELETRTRLRHGLYGLWADKRTAALACVSILTE